MSRTLSHSVIKFKITYISPLKKMKVLKFLFIIPLIMLADKLYKIMIRFTSVNMKNTLQK